MTLPHRRQLLQFAAGAAALPAMPKDRAGAGLSLTTCTLGRRLCTGRRLRHRRAAHGAMAAGAAWPALRYRKPPGCCDKHRDRGRRASRAGRLHTSFDRLDKCDQCHLLPEAQFQLHPRHRTRRRYHHATPSHVGRSIPFLQRQFPEVIAYAKANPGKVNVASPGVGAVSHLAGELFKSMAGVNLQNVPFGGNSPALTALLGGQVDILVCFASLGGGIYSDRQSQRTWSDDQDALRCATRGPEHQRIRPGL